MSVSLAALVPLASAAARWPPAARIPPWWSASRPLSIPHIPAIGGAPGCSFHVSRLPCDATVPILVIIRETPNEKRLPVSNPCHRPTVPLCVAAAADITFPIAPAPRHSRQRLMPRVTRKLLLPAVLVALVLLYIHLPSFSFLPLATPSLRDMHSTADAAGGQKPLRLAILEADTPQPQANAKYNGYGGMFISLLTAACKTLEPPQELAQQFTTSSHDVVNDLNSYPALDDIDAVLISGSRHNAFDDDPWIVKLVEFTAKALATNRIRIVGVCFGHQIVGRALGAKVGKSDKGWEVAVTEVDLTDKGKQIFGLEKMRIHQMHRDIVFDFPTGAIPLGGNEKCAVQAMYRPGQYISVQGHPEFTNDIVAEVMTKRHNAGVFDDAMYKDGMARTPLEHDGVKIAKAFIEFLRQ